MKYVYLMKNAFYFLPYYKYDLTDIFVILIVVCT